jgi:peptidoglycan-associated lipoprotein
MTTQKLIGALAAVALLAACGSDSSSDQAATGAGGAGLGGSGTVRPGSQEDLVANIGDRVFFETDRATIRADQRPCWSGRPAG